LLRLASVRRGFPVLALAGAACFASGTARAEHAEPEPVTPASDSALSSTPSAPVMPAHLGPRADGKQQSVTDESVRQSILLHSLEEGAKSAWGERYLGAIVGTAFVGLGVGATVAEFDGDHRDRQRWTTIAVAGGIAAVSFSSYAVPDDYRRPVLDSLGGLILAGGGVLFNMSDRNTAWTRFTFGTVIATGGAMVGLVGLDSALKRPFSARVLERHAARLRRDGASVSSAEQAQMERDLALTERPIPRWVSPLVLALGAAVAATPIFAKGASADDKAVSAVMVSSMLFASGAGFAAGALYEPPYRGYLLGLRGLHWVPLGPSGSAGLTLSGLL